jgi:hypothetical protein
MIRAERSKEVTRKQLVYRTAWLEYLNEYLARIGDVQTTEIWKPGPGQPRNITAYFVLLDAAAIFEWLTGVQATREVDRDNGKEIGSFFQFASVRWSVIFQDGIAGLPAAMKNWAEWRSEYDEPSALIANIAAGHPEWGLSTPR